MIHFQEFIARSIFGKLLFTLKINYIVLTHLFTKKSLAYINTVSLKLACNDLIYRSMDIIATHETASMSNFENR